MENQPSTDPTGRLSDVTLPPESVIDLHMHTTASDGRFTPEELARACQELGLSVIALADHDRLDNVIPLKAEAAKHGIHVIPAVEVSCQWDGVTYHLLAYNVNLADERLAGVFEAQKKHYAEVCAAGLAELALKGKPVDAAILAICHRGQPIAPYHVFQALIKHEYAPNLKEAHELAKTVGIDFVPWPEMKDVIGVVRSTGAIPVLAHPARAEPGFNPPSEATLDAMIEAGLMGFEVWHPYHSSYDVAWYLKLCTDRGLLTSSGSDTHSASDPRRMLTRWPARYSQALLQACGVFPMD